METTQTTAQPSFDRTASPQHLWLQRLIGDWVLDSDDGNAAGHTFSITPIGEFWIRAEGAGEMPDGGPADTLMVLGFDPPTGQFVGSWVGAMMSHLWIYEGELDDSETVLTLHTHGPDFGGDGRTTRYKDIVEIEDDDRWIFRAEMQTEDGSWKQIMWSRFRRDG